jgi:hypothetical protein
MQNPGRFIHLVDLVKHSDDTESVGGEATYPIEEDIDRGRRKHSSRLVQDQHGRIRGQRPSDLDSLLRLHRQPSHDCAGGDVDVGACQQLFGSVIESPTPVPHAATGTPIKQRQTLGDGEVAR